MKFENTYVITYTANKKCLVVSVECEDKYEIVHEVKKAHSTIPVSKNMHM